MTNESHPLLKYIHWLGHSSFRIGDSTTDLPVIYIDPWRLPDDGPLADIILISHDHHDHCSPGDVERIRTSDTIVVGNPAVARVLGPGTTVLRAWQSAPTIGSITLRSVPAYTPEKALHSKDLGGLGFLLTLSDYSVVYFAGDTAIIPEMERVDCDIALLPVDGIQTMSPEEAAQAARMLQPQHAIPMHYGSGVAGTRFDGSRFCDLVKPPVHGVLLPNEGKEVPTTGPLG